ncbi:hypothetical protein KCV07_g246, partial [Aureobasidium melanogenum]
MSYLTRRRGVQAYCVVVARSEEAAFIKCRRRGFEYAFPDYPTTRASAGTFVDLAFLSACITELQCFDKDIILTIRALSSNIVFQVCASRMLSTTSLSITRTTSLRGPTKSSLGYHRAVIVLIGFVSFMKESNSILQISREAISIIELRDGVVWDRSGQRMICGQ